MGIWDLGFDVRFVTTSSFPFFAPMTEQMLLYLKTSFRGGKYQYNKAAEHLELVLIITFITFFLPNINF